MIHFGECLTLFVVHPDGAREWLASMDCNEIITFMRRYPIHWVVA